MKKHLLMSAAVFLGSLSLKAQNNIIPCHTDEHYFEHYLEQNPGAVKRLEAFQNGWEVYKKAPLQSKKAAVIKIPVVFHVIHQYGSENISKAQIEDQIRVLNEDFRRLNADAVNTRPVFMPVAADVEIEFVLARKDPSGNCHEGINRIYSSLTNNADDNAKKLSYWPSDRYLNVWVVKSIESSAGDGTTTLGYAQFPWDRSARPTTDGIIVRADYVGTIGTAANSGNKGRVTTHEIGHWLGLFHTFQGGCSNVSWGEKIDDTPPVSAASFGCNLSANTCSNDVPNLPDQIENYMDYANGSCMNMFTLGQKDLMHYVLDEYRSVLISGANAAFTGIESSPGACAPRAEFSNKVFQVCEGGQVTFSDLSYNGVVGNRLWLFEGGTPSSSSLENPVVTYNTPGVYKVTLEVSNGAGSNSMFRDSVVIIRPAIGKYAAQFSEGLESSVFPPSDWTLDNSIPGGFQRVTSVSHSGGASARVLINQNTLDGATFSMITPPIDLGAVSDPSINFWVAHAQRGTSLERLKVYVSTDCGQTWVFVYQRAGTSLATAPATTGSFVPTASQWASHQIVLSSFKGRRNLLVKFEVQSNSGNNLYIDDINIGSISSAQTFNSSSLGVKVYPNPSFGSAVLEYNAPTSGEAEIYISDISGRKVAIISSGFIAEGLQRKELDLSALEQGMYFVNIQVGSNVVVEKLMIIR